MKFFLDFSSFFYAKMSKIGLQKINDFGVLIPFHFLSKNWIDEKTENKKKKKQNEDRAFFNIFCFSQLEVAEKFQFSYGLQIKAHFDNIYAIFKYSLFSEMRLLNFILWKAFHSFDRDSSHFSFVQFCFCWFSFSDSINILRCW